MNFHHFTTFFLLSLLIINPTFIQSKKTKNSFDDDLNTISKKYLDDAADNCEDPNALINKVESIVKEYVEKNNKKLEKKCTLERSENRTTTVGKKNTKVYSGAKRKLSSSPMYTEKGCKCLERWSSQGFGDCKEYCCNPDNDPGGLWCFVEDETCQGTNWGYCNLSPAMTTPTMTPTLPPTKAYKNCPEDFPFAFQPSKNFAKCCKTKDALEKDDGLNGNPDYFAREDVCFKDQTKDCVEPPCVDYKHDALQNFEEIKSLVEGATAGEHLVLRIEGEIEWKSEVVIKSGQKVTIVGVGVEGRAGAYLDARKLNRHFLVQGELSIVNVLLRNGKVEGTEGGGSIAVVEGGKVGKIERCVFVGNEAGYVSF